MKKHKWLSYVLWILFTEGVGFLSGWLTREGSQLYSQTIVKPPLSPPAMVFPIVWGILFVLMGIGAARIYLAEPSPERTRGLRIFLLQLAFNFFWSILFFNFQVFGIALIWLLILWGLILWMIFTFRQVDPLAAWLQVPYLLWVSFAAYLNFGVWRLN
ncbi:TspO/MBR family protein [uncultured Flavonifractor sp.]|uniref:TspO/MBR family protein n=1 Tax=uncultured Flavonifractor sp. TaxID=1193534 RepID=UPI00260744BB|nr:TspO/MBR family protein [uncultured Flavonifractor sp.]